MGIAIQVVPCLPLGCRYTLKLCRMILKAEPSDIPKLVALVNSCYRGQNSKLGWTTEANIISGDIRIDAAGLALEFADADVTILKYCDANGEILGTVYLKTQTESVYLGMLSVSPGLQNSGIGRQLMQAAESFATHQGLSTIEMTVINLRHELIAWYKKLGYAFTGEQKPFPENDYGKALVPLHFEVMAKHIS